MHFLGRHIYAGIATYKLGSDDGDWLAAEYENQIDVSRCFYGTGSHGHIHFSAKWFRDNTKGIVDLLKANSYPSKVSIPPYPWKNLPAASTPERLRLDGSALVWDEDDQVRVRLTKVFISFVFYRLIRV